MPVYLFTFHAYRSWMPDRPRGFVRRGEGILPPDEALARQYRSNATKRESKFVWEIQNVLIDELRIAVTHQSLRLHCVATDLSHLHILVSWKDGRKWIDVKRNLKSSLTRRLKREWNDIDPHAPRFSRNGSRKRVKDEKHFEHLMMRYLPDHRGAFWSERVDSRPQSCDATRCSPLDNKSC